MNFTTKILYTSAIALLATLPAIQSQAAENTKNKKEVTELVGYNVKEATIPEETKFDPAFNKIDKDRNGLINFKEFQNAALLEDEYAIFKEIDKNGDDGLTFEEFFGYNKTKGETKVESTLHGKAPIKGTNLVSRVYTENNYYVPVDPVVVDVQPVEE